MTPLKKVLTGYDKINKAERTSRKNKIALMDALNLIDEQAEEMGGTYEERKAREKAYNKLADFIRK